MIMSVLLTILTLCLDSTLTLCSPAIDDTLFYNWSTGAQSACIALTGTTEGDATYICEARTKTFLTTDNLMANGDFENHTVYTQQPTGFTSDYEYLPFDPYGTNLYDLPQYQGKSGVYLLSNNAKHTWRDYANVGPHSGNLFAMFDAAQSGYAWKAGTPENPGLQIMEGGLYVFSYWAADLNEAFQRNHPAQLQFTIRYKMPDGTMKKDSLGEVLTLGKDNKWHYSQTFWTSPITSDSIEIGVEDLNSFYGQGNDFGLDDIIFQMVTLEGSKLIATDTFKVHTEDCTPCQNFVYRKWNDVLFADNKDGQFVRYQWYADSVAIEGATLQFYQLTDTITPHQYYVEATLENGRIRTSCAQVFEQFTPSVTQPAANCNRLVIDQGHLYIQTEDAIYDILGNKLRNRLR